MTPAFRRLSAAGASALSCWRLDAPPDALARLFGPAAARAAAAPRLVRAGPPGAAFDEGLLLAAAGGAELHLHGGEGVARALRAWLSSAGWREQPAPASAPAEDFPDAAAARRRFSAADSPLAARAWSAFAAAGGAAGVLAAQERVPAPERPARARERLRLAGWAQALEVTPVLALAGPPNAGKSTLFNAWLGAQRATVADAPGTTRDAVGESLRLGSGADAWTLRLADTAGLWAGASGVDDEAAARSEAVIAAAWRVLWVFDAATPPDPRAARVFSARARAEDLRLLHRADLGEGWSPESALGGAWLRGSARHEPAELLERLERAVRTGLGPPPEPGEAPPFGAALRARLGAIAAGPG